MVIRTRTVKKLHATYDEAEGIKMIMVEKKEAYLAETKFKKSCRALSNAIWNVIGLAIFIVGLFMIEGEVPTALMFFLGIMFTFNFMYIIHCFHVEFENY